MSEKKVALIVNRVAEKQAPADEINLLPGLHQRLRAGASVLPGRRKMRPMSVPPLRLAAWLSATLVLASGLFLATPQGQGLAQSIMQFFTRAESDQLPVQSFQQTPLPSAATPDPGDISNATLTIAQVEALAGYTILDPAVLPNGMEFVGATFESEKRSARLFFRDAEMNGLVLREEPFQLVDDCALCGKVGASASVEAVQIGSITGEYSVGVWKLTETGPMWEPDPYLQTLRWQDRGMAFELLYMGNPDSLTKTDMIAIAESLQ